MQIHRLRQSQYSSYILLIPVGHDVYPALIDPQEGGGSWLCVYNRTLCQKWDTISRGCINVARLTTFRCGVNDKGLGRSIVVLQ